MKASTESDSNASRVMWQSYSFIEFKYSKFESDIAQIFKKKNFFMIVTYFESKVHRDYETDYPNFQFFTYVSAPRVGELIR